jgi:hypothetical protein
MSQIAIKDIYAGMLDAKYEMDTNQAENFYACYVLPPEFPANALLDGKKYFVTGYKGVGKTSVLFYLQNELHKRDESSCTSFLYFKSDYTEFQKSSMETVGKKLTAIVDVSGSIQPNKVEFLHLWRWVFFNKIVDDCKENSNGLFFQDDYWSEFVENVKKISFSSKEKKVISLSSLSVSMQAALSAGLSATVSARFEPISKSERAFGELVEIVDKCEQLFKKLTRTDIPYYLFVDEIEAFYGDDERFRRDLTLIRDMIFTIHRLNSYHKVNIIGAIRSEVIFAMDRFISTGEINKITDSFSVPIRWTYNNTTSYNHPIIQILGVFIK